MLRKQKLFSRFLYNLKHLIFSQFKCHWTGNSMKVRNIVHLINQCILKARKSLGICQALSKYSLMNKCIKEIFRIINPFQMLNQCFQKSSLYICLFSTGRIRVAIRIISNMVTDSHWRNKGVVREENRQKEVTFNDFCSGQVPSQGVLCILSQL